MRNKIFNSVISCLKSLVIISMILGVIACAPKKNRGVDGSEDQNGAGDPMRFFGTDLSAEQERELLAQNTYYFGYDRFDLSDSDTASIDRHAKRLMNSSRSRIRVEGHTDERGSGEYNVALGERRANAVANILMLKGVNQHQITVVSYGKEKPHTSGHEESAWSKNRRAVIVYEVE